MFHWSMSFNMVQYKTKLRDWIGIEANRVSCNVQAHNVLDKFRFFTFLQFKNFKNFYF